MMVFFRFLIFFLLFLINGLTLFAFQPIEIVVRDSQRTALPGATVKLTNLSNAKDYYKITDENGIAGFDLEADEKYLILVTYVGYEPTEQELTVDPGQPRIHIKLLEQSISLEEVTVVGRRPVIRQEGDKTIFDPESLAAISTNTMELLETLPGVFVDPEGGVFLSSVTPAAIYINGREQRMGTQNVMAVLRSLPPSSIERIEMIRTPSSKFDAASSGGIINIVLKKGYKIGRFGTANAGMNQGALGNRFVGFNLNNSGDKSAYYLNVSYNYNASEVLLNSHRLLDLERNLQQEAITRSFSNQGYAGYGISYDFSDRLVMNYDGRINASLPRSNSNNANTIESFESVLLSENDNHISNDSKSLNLQQEIGIKLQLDTVGSEWDNRFSYNYNNSSASQDYATSFFFPGDFMYSGFGDNNQHRHFLTLQSDLTLTFPGQKVLETGLKGSYQEYFSDADYYITRDAVTLSDETRTNAFNYNELINSAYVQASAPLPGDLLLKAGLRLEQTYMNGFQTVPSDTSFLVNRVDLFPYVFLSRRVFDIAGYEMRAYMIYRRSINRPDFQNLNPYNRFVDQYLFETGNPALKPQFTENVEANISFDEIPIFAVGRSYVQDIFSQVIYQDKDDNNIAVRTYDNVGRNRETYFRIAGAIPPGKAYFFVAGAQYNYNVYDGIYQNQPLSFSRGSWRFFTFHSLNLGKQTRLTMSGFMMLKGQQNFYELKTMGMLNFGLTHSMLDRKLTVSLSARDVLRTMEAQFSLNQGTMPASGSRYSDTQRFGINIRYNFGIRNKPERDRTNIFDFEDVE